MFPVAHKTVDRTINAIMRRFEGQVNVFFLTHDAFSLRHCWRPVPLHLDQNHQRTPIKSLRFKCNITGSRKYYCNPDLKYHQHIE